MISIIVATSENNVIGKDNKLIWKQSEDLKRFKRLTSGNTVIMGRKTYESIGRPLPKRVNIVISRNSDLSIEGVMVVNSLEEAILKSPRDRDTFIIGGSSIYNLALKYADRIDLTRIHGEFEGDCFFGDSTILKTNGFRVLDADKYASDETNENDYSFITYIRP